MQNENTISEKIIMAEYEAVYHYALSFCKNEAEAKDVTQETFLKAFQKSERFRGESSLFTWLCKIAKNIWIDQCKKTKKEMPFDSDVIQKEANGKSLDSILIDKDSSKRVHQILHDMKEPYKEVFSLRVFGELSFAEISDLFGKSESWARVTYHRATKSITEQLKKEGMLDE